MLILWLLLLILEVLLLSLEVDVLHLGALVAQLWQAFQLPWGPLGEAWGRSGGGLGELWVAACWAWFLYYSLRLQPILLIIFLEGLAHLRALDAHLGGCSCSSWDSCC